MGFLLMEEAIIVEIIAVRSNLCEGETQVFAGCDKKM
jgi:hypothetical protein